MILKIKMTEELLRLINGFQILELKEGQQYGVDVDHLYGGTYLYEQMAEYLGWMDKVIPSTKEDPDGAKFEPETMKKLVELDEYVTKHLIDIEEIIHQFATKGGIKKGIYRADDAARIWKFSED